MSGAAQIASAERVYALPSSVWRPLGRALLGLLCIGFLLCEIYPIFWLLVSSVKAPDEFTLYPIYSMPRGLHWHNYIDAYQAGMLRYFRNSLIATVPAVFITVLFAAAAAFAIETMKWRYSQLALITFLTGIMIPLQMVLLPIFAVFLKVHLLNTL